MSVAKYGPSFLKTVPVLNPSQSLVSCKMRASAAGSPSTGSALWKLSRTCFLLVVRMTCAGYMSPFM